MRIRRRAGGGGGRGDHGGRGHGDSAVAGPAPHSSGWYAQRRRERAGEAVAAARDVRAAEAAEDTARVRRAADENVQRKRSRYPTLRLY